MTFAITNATARIALGKIFRRWKNVGSFSSELDFGINLAEGTTQPEQAGTTTGGHRWSLTHWIYMTNNQHSLLSGREKRISYTHLCLDIISALMSFLLARGFYQEGNNNVMVTLLIGTGATTLIIASRSLLKKKSR
jgi:hypothetical protein